MSLLFDVKMSAPLTYELYIYDNVMADWYDWWEGEMKESETSAGHFRKLLSDIPGNARINLYINSLGGSVKEGLSIFNQLKRHPAHKTGYIDGFACSIASVIPMACDLLIMPKNTLMMLHFAWWVVSGNPAQLRKSADDLDVINEAVMQSYLQKAGDRLSRETLLDLLSAESWLTAEDCMNYGLIDSFADTDADMTAAKAFLERAQATQGKSPAAVRFTKVAAAALSKIPTPHMAGLPTAQPLHPQQTAPPPPIQTEPESRPVADAFSRLLSAFID